MTRGERGVWFSEVSALHLDIYYDLTISYGSKTILFDWYENALLNNDSKRQNKQQLNNILKIYGAQIDL